MRYRYLLFDLDHTLLDFHATARSAFFRTMQAFQVDVQHAHWQYYQRLNAQYWKAFEQGRIDVITLRIGRWRDLFAHMREWRNPREVNHYYLEQVSQSAIAIDGASSLLHQLHRKKQRMAIITNGLSQVQRPRLARSGFQAYFDFALISDEVGYLKPQTAFFDQAFRQITQQLGHQPQPEEVLVIGDSLEADIKGGNDYGCHTCWFNPKGLTAPPDLQPHYEISHLREVLMLTSPHTQTKP